MLALSLSLLILVSATAQSAEPSAPVADDVETAARIQRVIRVCRPDDLGPVYALIRRYGARREPGIRLAVARARMSAAGAFRFVGHREQARHWFTSVVRLYANDNGEELRGIVASARYELIAGIADSSARLGRLSELATQLAARSNPGETRAYYDTIREMSDLLEQRGDNVRAAALRQQAHGIWRSEVEPRLSLSSGEENICV